MALPPKVKNPNSQNPLAWSIVVLAEIADNIKEKLDIRPVKWIDEVLSVALTHVPTPLASATDAKPAEAIAAEKPRRRAGRVKNQVRARP